MKMIITIIFVSCSNTVTFIYTIIDYSYFLHYFQS